MKNHEVISNIKISDDIFYLTLAKNDLVYDIGNCVSIYGEDGYTSRFYSLASAPNENTISFLIKMIGGVSNYLSTLKTGQLVKLSNPFGVFKPHEHKDSIFISTGTGLAPFLSCLKSDKNISPKMLYCGVRHHNDIPFYKDLVMKWKTTFAVSSHYPKKRVTNYLIEDIESNDYDLQKTHFYICGLNSMIEDVKMVLIKNSTPLQNIHYEIFFRDYCNGY